MWCLFPVFSWFLVPKCQGGETLLGLSVQMNFQWFLHHLAIRVAMVEDAVVQILKQNFGAKPISNLLDKLLAQSSFVSVR